MIKIVRSSGSRQLGIQTVPTRVQGIYNIYGAVTKTQRSHIVMETVMEKSAYVTK